MDPCEEQVKQLSIYAGGGAWRCRVVLDGVKDGVDGKVESGEGGVGRDGGRMIGEGGYGGLGDALRCVVHG